MGACLFISPLGPGNISYYHNNNPAAVAYYLPGTTGWGGWGSTYGTIPAVMVTPQIAGANSGVSTNGFGFTINGAAGMVVVVEASNDLINWQPILTNTPVRHDIQFQRSAMDELSRSLLPAAFAVKKLSQPPRPGVTKAASVAEGRFEFTVGRCCRAAH